nr:hypothetical protein [Tanacetum cinerariifolium]
MSWYSRCSWCGGPFNGINYWCCTNPQTSSSVQFHYFGCGDPIEEGVVVNVVLASGVKMVLEKDFASFALQEMEIHPLMILIRTLSIILQKFSPTLDNPSSRHTCASYVGTILTMSFYDDDDDDDYEESTNPLPPSILITTSPPILPIEDPEDSLIMGDEDLNTIPEKESDELIKSSVEDLVPIPSESEDTSGSGIECILPSFDDFSSDDESLSDEDVPKDNVKIYSNPLFEFDDEYISSDINPLFDEVLEDIEGKVSYDSNLYEPTLLVTPNAEANEDECFDPGDDVDEIELLLHHDPSTLKMSIASILEGLTEEPPLEENDDLFDLESKENKWKKILIEDTIFDPDISAFHFLAPVASHRSGTFISFNVYPNILNESPMKISSSTRFNPNIRMIWGPFAVIDNEFEEWARSCELMSFWPAAATVGILASLWFRSCASRSQTGASQSRQST